MGPTSGIGYNGADPKACIPIWFGVRVVGFGIRGKWGPHRGRGGGANLTRLPPFLFVYYNELNLLLLLLLNFVIILRIGPIGRDVSESDICTPPDVCTAPRPLLAHHSSLPTRKLSSLFLQIKPWKSCILLHALIWNVRSTSGFTD